MLDSEIVNIYGRFLFIPGADRRILDKTYMFLSK